MIRACMMRSSRFALGILVAAMGAARPELAAATQPAAAAPISPSAVADAREEAIQQMDHPDAVEALLQAASHRDLRGQLDYALFL